MRLQKTPVLRFIPQPQTVATYPTAFRKTETGDVFQRNQPLRFASKSPSQFPSFFNQPIDYFRAWVTSQRLQHGIHNDFSSPRNVTAYNRLLSQAHAKKIYLELQNRGLDGLKLKSLDLVNSVWHGSALGEARFEDTSLVSATLTRVNAPRVKFLNSNLSRADFYHSSLNGATFNGCTMQNTRMIYAALENATFINSDLAGLDIRRAEMTGASFDSKSLISLLSHPATQLSDQMEYAYYTPDPEQPEKAFMLINVFEGADLPHTSLAELKYRLANWLKRHPEITAKDPAAAVLAERFPKIYESLAWINQMPHDFRRYLFDTRKLPASDQCLLEEYGARRLPTRPKDGIYGPGFLLEKKRLEELGLPDGSLFELRQAYIQVSVPDQGTLRIPNHSRNVIDRHNLKAAFYSSPEALDRGKIMNDTADVPAIESTEGVVLTPEQVYLVDKIRTFQDQYRRWKFDNTRVDGQTKQSQAHLSPGLPKLIQALIDRESTVIADQLSHGNNAAKPNSIPGLSFVSPQPPLPDQPLLKYPYTEVHGLELRAFQSWLKGDTKVSPSDFIDLLAFLKKGLAYKDVELILETHV